MIKFQKETTRITSFGYRSTYRNTLQQGMDYSLDFFGSTRKVSIMFSLGGKYYLLYEIKKYFAEGNDSVVEMLSSLAIQYDSYKEKARSGKLGKSPQHWFILTSLIYKQWHIVLYKTMIQKNWHWSHFLFFHFTLCWTNKTMLGMAVFMSPLLLNMEARVKDTTHPGLKTLLAEEGTSVQGQVENFG